MSDEIIALPPPLEEDMTDVVSTRNIVLKRKQPTPIGEIKKTKNETDITIVQHPIFRKLLKQKKNDDKISKILSKKTPLDIKIEKELLATDNSSDLPALMSSSELPTLMSSSDAMPLVSVDAETMRRMPWIDFNIMLDNTEQTNREQVILDILQNNMPNIGDDMYYIDRDPETNVFSIKTDHLAEEIQDFTESIPIIDARLKIEILSAEERKKLLAAKKFKIGVLRNQYNAHQLASVLENKISPSKKVEMEEELIEKLNELNEDEDRYTYRFNDETQKFEIMLEDNEIRLQAVVFSLMMLDRVINDTSKLAYKTKT